MLQVRYATDKFFNPIYKLTVEMEPVLDELETLLDDKEFNHLLDPT